MIFGTDSENHLTVYVFPGENFSLQNIKNKINCDISHIAVFVELSRRLKRNLGNNNIIYNFWLVATSRVIPLTSLIL